jgi:hypothetical protein
MVAEHGVSLLVDRAPKLVFIELLGCETFGKQAVQLFEGSYETRHCALFNGRHCGLYNLFNGTVRATANDGSNPALLFRREMNGHVLSLLAYAIFRVGEEFPTGKSNETLEGQVGVAIWQRN